MTRTLKASYPMIFEIAVYLANRLQERLGIPLVDEEIAYIATCLPSSTSSSRSSTAEPRH